MRLKVPTGIVAKERSPEDRYGCDDGDDGGDDGGDDDGDDVSNEANATDDSDGGVADSGGISGGTSATPCSRR